MPREIPERDWKVFKELRAVALERFCERVLKETERLLSNSGSAHDRYVAVYRLIEERDREIADAFNDFRRSRAIFQLALIVRLGLARPEELERFTPETQDIIAELTRVIHVSPGTRSRNRR